MKKCLRCGYEVYENRSAGAMTYECMSREKCGMMWIKESKELPLEYLGFQFNGHFQCWKFVPRGCLGIFGWEEI